MKCHTPISIVILLFLNAVLLSACGGGGSSNNNGNNNSGNNIISTTGTVGATGGTIATPKGVEIAIPAGSLLGSTTLTLTPIDVIAGLPSDVTLEPGSAYRIDWVGAGFAPDGTATIRYPDSGTQPTAAVRNGVARAPTGPTGYVLMCENGYAPMYLPPEQVWIYLKFGATMGACPSVSGSGSVQTGRVTGQAPVISTQPASVVTRPLNEPAYFSVFAVGTGPLSYQWRRDGVDIANATSSVYTIDAVSNADNGAHFSVVVKNAFGSVTSSEAVLLIAAPDAPTIVLPPQGLTVAAGQPATFHVVGGNAISMTISWQRSNDGATWNTVQAAVSTTDSTYTLNSPTIADDNGAHFRAVLCNNVITAATCVTSASMTLSVVTAGPVVITQQPAVVNLPVGDTAVLQVEAVGAAPLTYQWFFNDTPLTDRSSASGVSGISGANTSTLTISNVQNEDVGDYSVLIGNSAGSVISVAAPLTIGDHSCTGPGNTGWCKRTGGNRMDFLAFGSSTKGIAVGPAGEVSRTADGGVTWNESWIPDLNSSVFWPWDVAYADSNTVLMVGLDTVSSINQIFRSADGGDTWDQVYSAAYPGDPGATNYVDRLGQVVFANANLGLVADGTSILRTTNGGATWTSVAMPQHFPETTDIFRVQEIVFPGDGSALALLWANGAGNVSHILRSIDGGQTWTTFSSVSGQILSSLYGLSFANTNNGIAAIRQGTTAWSTDPQIARTTDGGKTWNLVTVTGSHGSVYFRSVKMTPDGFAVAVTTAGEIARSADFGATWQWVQSGFTSVLTLKEVDSPSPGVFVIVGWNAVVLRNTQGGAGP